MKNRTITCTLLITVLGFCFTEAAIANKAASDIKVPFGIRHYDIGMAHNSTLNDMDDEKI